MSSTRITLLSCLAVVLAFTIALPAAAQVNFEAQLFGQNEVPPVATDAYGSCVGVLDETETTFTLSCEHNLDDTDVVGAHIHLGFGDENGPVIFDLGDPSSPIQAIWNLTTDDAIRLLAGGLYVNVHTEANPAGEIRGQLQPTAPFTDRRLVFPLRGDLVVPAVDTDASGACVAVVDLQPGAVVGVSELDVDLRCTHDVANAETAVIRLGGPGEEGDDVLVLDTAVSPIETSFAVTDTDLVQAFLDGGLYLEIESDAFPEGELRGQMIGCLEGATVLCLNDNRFELSVDWNTESDAGEGFAEQETDDSGLFWFFRPSNLELLVKVLDGCAVNDHYWVFFAGVTNVQFTLTVTDTYTGETRTYTNELGETAGAELDNAAFDTCP